MGCSASAYYDDLGNDYILQDGSDGRQYSKGDMFKVVDTTGCCLETSVGEIVVLREPDVRSKPVFTALEETGSGFRCCPWKALEKYTEPSGNDLNEQTYTQSELSYIEELEG